MVDNMSMTPLLIASTQGYSEFCSLLLAHGSDPEIKYPVTGGTALTAAAIGGHHSTALAIISAGADINLEERNSPLSMACQEGHLSTVLSLLQCQEVKAQSSAMNNAAKANKAAIVDILIDHGYDPEMVRLFFTSTFPSQLVFSGCWHTWKKAPYDCCGARIRRDNQGAPVQQSTS